MKHAWGSEAGNRSVVLLADNNLGETGGYTTQGTEQGLDGTGNISDPQVFAGAFNHLSVRRCAERWCLESGTHCPVSSGGYGM